MSQKLGGLREAVILAAGRGVRLGSLADARPKGLLEVGGMTLVDRSIAALRSNGIERVTIVTGFGHDAYERHFEQTPFVSLVRNAHAESAGTFVSLMVGLRAAAGPVLVLESDLVYDSRFLCGLLGDGGEDLLLVSTPTEATDEVWVELDANGCLVAMSKALTQVRVAHGELVGITRLSEASRRWFLDCDATLPHAERARACYETDGLVWLAQAREVRAVFVEGARWGEIDDAFHLARIERSVLPLLSVGELKS